MTSPVRLLIVDDEKHVCGSLEAWFLEEGYSVSTANSGLEALEVAAREAPQIMLVDIKMPQMDGLTLQRRVRELLPDVTLIIMTAFGSVDTAVQALKEGAFDYILKPFDPEQLSRLVSKAAAQYSVTDANRALLERLHAATPKVIGAETSPMAALVRQAHQVAPTDTCVYLQGEGGTGKRLLARLIHASSPRRFGPVMVLNCDERSDSTMEAELFGSNGHGGVHTSGERGRGGVELAHKGTLILAGVDNLPPRTQVDLLQVLEDGHLRRTGRTGPLPVDFRLICTTDRDLDHEAAHGRFNRDFLLHIGAFRMRVPPLRDRPEDIPPLAAHFLKLHGDKAGKALEGFTAAAMSRLCAHPWRGNVRELEHAIEGAVVTAQGPMMDAEHLPLVAGLLGEDFSLASAEARHVRRVLLICGHDYARAAREMGLDEAQLFQKMRKHRIERR